MEVMLTNSPSGYGKPPWVFKGSALYQFHLLKAKTVRPFIPKEFKIVETFGYTVGGFFLANYDDSPVGPFDELVVIAGIVQNQPTSCAWAAKVLVNNEEACNHGRKEFGLPSQVAKFSKRTTCFPRKKKGKRGGFLNMNGIVASSSSRKMDIKVRELGDPRAATGLGNISISSTVQEMDYNKYIGMPINISLPSLSGLTGHNPELLKYCCRIECRVRAVPSAKVWELCVGSEESSEDLFKSATGEPEENTTNISKLIMLSKPVLALEFNCMNMSVEAPLVIPRNSIFS